MTTVQDFARFKAQKRRISVVTAYDAWSARLVARSRVDAILIGDSVAMVMHGHPTTLAATVSLMALHTRAVARAGADKFLIADLPFLSHRRGIPAAMTAVGTLMRSGAQAVKLEGVDGHEDVIRQVVGSGVPVMGHIGLTPQSVNQFGGFRGTRTKRGRRGWPPASGADARGSRLLLDRARVRSGGPRRSDHVGADDSDNRHRRGTRDRRPGARAAGFVGRGPEPNAAFRPAIPRRRAPAHEALDQYDADVKEARFPALEESYS